MKVVHADIIVGAQILTDKKTAVDQLWMDLGIFAMGIYNEIHGQELHHLGIELQKSKIVTYYTGMAEQHGSKGAM